MSKIASISRRQCRAKESGTEMAVWFEPKVTETLNYSSLTVAWDRSDQSTETKRVNKNVSKSDRTPLADQYPLLRHLRSKLFPAVHWARTLILSFRDSFGQFLLTFSDATVTFGAITHKKITEPNFIIFELFSVIPALWLPNRFVSGINGSR